MAGEVLVSRLPPELRGDRVRLSASITPGLAGPGLLWFDIDSRYAPEQFDLADPFVLALLFPAMRAGCVLRIKGKVSRSLLENLERYSEVWSLWLPDLYKTVRVHADEEVELPAAGSERAVALFSGGLDSSYTILRHHRGLAGRQSRDIDLGVFVLGPGFRPAEMMDERFSRLAAETLESLGIGLCVIATNVRQFPADWSHSHGAALVSCLHWFSGTHRYGLLASGSTALQLEYYCGTHPALDRRLSSARFAIEDDGIVTQRPWKAELVGTWPEALDCLRVCFLAAEGEFNCGKCRKCIVTKIALLAGGHQLGSSLRPDPGWREIMAMRDLPSWSMDDLRLSLRRAKVLGLHDRPWYRAMQARLMIQTSLKALIRARGIVQKLTRRRAQFAE